MLIFKRKKLILLCKTLGETICNLAIKEFYSTETIQNRESRIEKSMGEIPVGEGSHDKYRN